MPMPPPEFMHDGQRETLARFVERCRGDESILGVVLSGSLVRGWGAPSSDVDVIVIVTEAEYERRKANATLTTYDMDIGTYEHGAIDTKHVTIGYLDLAEKQASEPTRNAFVKAHAAYDTLGDLQGRIDRIATYPEDQRERKLARFAAQLETYRWFVGEADKRENTYLRAWTSSHAALFAARLILTHNRMLFPFHKWVMRALDDCPEKPEGLHDAIERAVTQPTCATVHPLCDLVLGFREWPKDPLEWAGAFHRDTEQVWMRHEPGIDNI
ncbi:MAG: nucleotidyltransferase domain-containing protein [Planctomycetota bacterium]